MKKILLLACTLLTVTLTCGAKSKIVNSAASQLYVVASDFVASDGSVDVADALQELIDANPNKTIFFPDGTYLISKPLLTPADPTKAVHLVLANFAVIKASPDWKAGSGALVQLGGKYPFNSITINGSNYGIEGGIFDGSGVADGISVNSGRESRIDQVSIKNTQVGVHIMRGANSGSSDVDVIDVNIVGNNEPNSIGVLIEGHDNTFTNMRIYRINIGVMIKSGGNSLKNIHPLYGFGGNQDYESSIGFYIEHDSNNWLDYCYSDQFATGFKLGKGVSANLSDCFCWWYRGTVPFQKAIACDGPLAAHVYGMHVGFSKDCPVVDLLTAEPGGTGNMQCMDVRRKDFSPADVSASYMVR